MTQERGGRGQQTARVTTPGRGCIQFERAWRGGGNTTGMDATAVVRTRHIIGSGRFKGPPLLLLLLQYCCCCSCLRLVDARVYHEALNALRICGKIADCATHSIDFQPLRYIERQSARTRAGYTPVCQAVLPPLSSLTRNPLDGRACQPLELHKRMRYKMKVTPSSNGLAAVQKGSNSETTTTNPSPPYAYSYTACEPQRPYPHPSHSLPHRM